MRGKKRERIKEREWGWERKDIGIERVRKKGVGDREKRRIEKYGDKMYVYKNRNIEEDRKRKRQRKRE